MKNITLIITGSIAAIKAEKLYKLLKTKYHITVIATEAAMHFLNTNNIKNIKYKIFEKDKYFKGDDSDHISIAKNTDLTLIYPATYDFINKFANGIADNYALLYLTATRKPIYIFEAMNTRMLNNPIYIHNKKNLKKILPWTFFFDAKEGLLANGDYGFGRLWEPDDVFERINNFFNC